MISAANSSVVSATGSTVVSAASSSVISAANSSVVSAVGSSVVSAAVSSATTSAKAAALASLFSFSDASLALIAESSSLAIEVILFSILASFSLNHLANFSSACSFVKAPFLTPFNKWFLYNTPLYDSIALTVSVGCAPTPTQYIARSKSMSMVAGFVFGL